MASERPRLVGDIGGTNARFALATGTKMDRVEKLRVADFPTAEAALRHYMGDIGGVRPGEAVLAVAGPVTAGAVDLTNAKGWQLEEKSLAAALGLERVMLINDFTALALAVPHLTEADMVEIGAVGKLRHDATISLLGPGTGTGVGARVADGKNAANLVCEGGHTAFAPGDETETEVLRLLTRRFGRVSMERILCGQGLVNLHGCLAEIAGRPETTESASGITEKAAAGDADARATVERFCAILGSFAGDIALIHGARGGVVLAGGILPRLVPLLRASAFRARFEDKGRLSPYVRAIPSFLLLADDVAFRGAAAC